MQPQSLAQIALRVGQTAEVKLGRADCGEQLRLRGRLSA
jgi:hypothetical protein